MHVCIVDPSRTVRRIVGDMVRSWGYTPLCFGTGEEALRILAEDASIRALVTSAELPGCSGLALCQSARLRAGPRRPLYILFMSSSEEREKLIAALENGADDFISKPPSREELKARLRAADRITAMQSMLALQATTDHLTGTMNRRGFFEYADRQWAGVAKVQRVAALIADIDRFKTVNDEYGHAAGDHVLIAVAAALRQMNHTVGRLGGEEFAILLDGAVDRALDLAETLRQAVEQTVVHIEGKRIHPTCSVGVAESEPGDTIDLLLRRADMALYEAKRRGRNRVVAADTYLSSEQHQAWQGVARTTARSSAIEAA